MIKSLAMSAIQYNGKLKCQQKSLKDLNKCTFTQFLLSRTAMVIDRNIDIYIHILVPKINDILYRNVPRFFTETC